MQSTLDLVSMKGRTVLITGAASGIGDAAAYRFADAQADLILVDIDAGGLARVAEGLKRFGRSVATYQADLSTKHEVDQLWGRIGEAQPDTLINNASIYPMKDYLEVDEGFLRTTMAVNLESALWTCRKFIGLMKTGYDFQTRLALGRWGRPDEVARVMLFLASDLASHVQGAVIPVDGGFLSS